MQWRNLGKCRRHTPAVTEGCGRQVQIIFSPSHCTAIPAEPTGIRRIQVQIPCNKPTHNTRVAGMEEDAGEDAGVVGDGEKREDIDRILKENLAVSLQQEGEH